MLFIVSMLLKRQDELLQAFYRCYIHGVDQSWHHVNGLIRANAQDELGDIIFSDLLQRLLPEFLDVVVTREPHDEEQKRA